MGKFLRAQFAQPADGIFTIPVDASSEFGHDQIQIVTVGNLTSQRSASL